MWGKVVNAGQTCVAPDYVLVPKDFQDKFVGALKETYVLPLCFFHLYMFSVNFSLTLILDFASLELAPFLCSHFFPIELSVSVLT